MRWTRAAWSVQPGGALFYRRAPFKNPFEVYCPSSQAVQMHTCRMIHSAIFQGICGVSFIPPVPYSITDLNEKGRRGKAKSGKTGDRKKFVAMKHFIHQKSEQFHAADPFFQKIWPPAGTPPPPPSMRRVPLYLLPGATVVVVGGVSVSRRRRAAAPCRNLIFGLPASGGFAARAPSARLQIRNLRLRRHGGEEMVDFLGRGRWVLGDESQLTHSIRSSSPAWSLNSLAVHIDFFFACGALSELKIKKESVIHKPPNLPQNGLQRASNPQNFS
ncbi:hypothetical protein C8R47DRAFT_1277202 [Mycena vitilis]|nr:hypothetical protein C8R47DRAFT_1277202 [Mycena vitilis]